VNGTPNGVTSSAGNSGIFVDVGVEMDAPGHSFRIPDCEAAPT
jgi:hypothetical protein